MSKRKGPQAGSKQAFGSYLFPHAMTRAKQREVREVLRAYRRAARGLLAYHLRRFYETGHLDRRLDPTKAPLTTPLSDRYLWVCSQQVVDILSGYLGVLEERVRALILGSTLPEEQKGRLLRLNARGLWQQRDVKTVKVGGQEMPVLPEDLRLLRHLFRRARKENRLPRLGRIAMHLDGKVARLEARKDWVPKRKNRGWRARRGEGVALFPLWLHLSSLVPRQPIAVPLEGNPYAEGVPGAWRNFFQIGEEGGRVYVRRVKALEGRPYTPRTERLALDVGLSPLMATDRGDLLGRGFLRLLQAYDAEIQAIARKAQREGRRLREVQEYREAVARLRAFLKNEVNRLLNRLVALHAPRVLVVERLDLRAPGLSRRMNRLLSNFGRRYFKEKLERLEVLYGIQVVEVNPAYTSQTCSSCGYVDPGNRQDTQAFRCLACGREINAQVNAARNLLGRSSSPDGWRYTPKRQILQALLRECLERPKGGWSAARGPWGSNPYRVYLPPGLQTPPPGNKRG